MNFNGTKYRVAVVGGGCAGAAAAFIAVQSGLKTILIDKDQFPRFKLCGGLITEKTIKLLSEIYGQFNLSNIIDSDFRTFGIYHSDLGRICRYTDPLDKLYFTEREIFDHFFLNKVKNIGCHVLLGDAIISLTGNSLTTKSGKIIIADYIICADGANSTIRTLTGLKANKKNSSFGLQVDAEYDNLTCFQNGDIYPQIHFNFIKKGYAWVFPFRSTVKIGIGGPVEDNENIKNIFISFLKTITKDISILAGDIKGFPVPFNNYLSNPVHDNILFAGDSAGLIEPITGEGIYFSILSGYLAATSIINYNDPPRQYEYFIKNKIHSFLKQGYLFKKLLFNKYIFPFAMKKIMNNQKYSKYYFNLLSGNINYYDFVYHIIKDRIISSYI